MKPRFRRRGERREGGEVPRRTSWSRRGRLKVSGNRCLARRAGTVTATRAPGPRPLNPQGMAGVQLGKAPPAKPKGGWKPMTPDGPVAQPGGSAPAAGHGPETLVVPATAAQAAYLADLMQRARDCQDRLVPVSEGNLLRVLSGERRAGLDMRLAGHEMDGPGRIAEVAARVAGRWRSHGGLQVVFCDTGLHSGPQDPWSIRSELAACLSGHGVPGAVFAFPGETRWPAATAALGETCREGAVSVLIGSTADLLRVPAVSKMVTAAHHLDVPFSAFDARQRAALEPPGAVFRYVTGGYTDAARWGAADAGADLAAAALAALSGPAPAARTGPPAGRRRARATGAGPAGSRSRPGHQKPG